VELEEWVNGQMGEYLFQPFSMYFPKN
jgi:hypothetical protein